MKKIIIILLVIVGGLWVIWYLPNKNSSAVVTDFLACQKAGRPVIDTYPRTCQGSDNKTYIEVVDEKELNTDPVIFSPDLSRPVTSPLIINGEARGFWFFERQFEVRLIDDKGKEVATGTAKTKSPTATIDFISFNITLNFKNPATKMGTLVLEKANPSGLASQARSVQLPVLFRDSNLKKDIQTAKAKDQTASSSTGSSSPSSR